MEKNEKERSYRIHIRHGEFELDIEGDRAFVESYLEALFLEEEAAVRVAEPKPSKKAKAPALPEPGRKRGRPRKAEAPARTAPAGKKARKGKYGSVEMDRKALAAFTAGKAVKSNKERYHLYMQFLRSAGYKEAADAHVQACFRAEGLEVPPTGRQHFRTLMKQGFVRPGSRRGLWTLTEEGAAFDFGVAKGAAPKGGARRKAAKKAGRRPAKKAAAKKAGRAGVKKAAEKTASKARPKKAVKPAAAKARRGRPGRKPKAEPVPAAPASDRAAVPAPPSEGSSEPSESA